MAFKDITEGEKTGVALAARFIKSEGGKQSLGLEVSFSFEEPNTGTQETLARVFWLTKDSIKKSMETLVEVLNYNGSEETDQDGNIIDKNAISKNPVKLVVEMDTNEENGKSYPKIKWVNNLGGSGFAGATKETIKSDLESVGFKGAYLAARKGNPTPQTNQVNDSQSWTGDEKEEKGTQGETSFDPDDIPF